MSSIVFIHALSKEGTQKLLNKELFIESTQDYIIISDPKITTNDVKHRIEKAVAQKQKYIHYVSSCTKNQGSQTYLRLIQR